MQDRIFDTKDFTTSNVCAELVVFELAKDLFQQNLPSVTVDTEELQRIITNWDALRFPIGERTYTNWQGFEGRLSKAPQEQIRPLIFSLVNATDKLKEIILQAYAAKQFLMYGNSIATIQESHSGVKRGETRTHINIDEMPFIKDGVANDISTLSNAAPKPILNGIKHINIRSLPSGGNAYGILVDSDINGLMENTAPVPTVLIDIAEPVRVNQLVGKTFNGGWDAIDTQVEIVFSELSEMIESIARRDYKTLQDDNMDVFFTAAGMLGISGMLLNAGIDFERVCENQYSKFDTSLEDAETTASMFAKQGMVTRYSHVVDQSSGKEYWITLSDADQLDAKGRKCPKNKWLKSHKYSDPQLTLLPGGVVERLHVDEPNASSFIVERLGRFIKTLEGIRSKVAAEQGIKL